METGFDTQPVGHGDDLRHDIDHDAADTGITRHLRQRRPGERAQRIECNIAEQFDPDFLADSRRDGATEARANQRFGDGAASFGPASIGLAKGDAVSFHVPDDARLSDFRPQIDDGSDHARRVDGIGYDSAGIDALQIAVPPGDAVLRADYRGRGSDERL